jgi:O-antigen ligase
MTSAQKLFSTLCVGAGRLAPFVLVVALCFASSRLPPTATITGLLLVAALGIVLALRMDSLELLVAAMPLTFYGDIGGRVNFSVADFFLIALILRLLTDRSFRDVGNQLRRFGTYIWVCALFLFAVMTVGVILASAAGHSVAWPAYFMDSVKLLIVLVYLSACLLAFVDKFIEGDLRFMRIWIYTAVAVSLLGIGGSLLYTRGIDLGLTMSFRARSTFEDPNAYATYLIASLGVTMMWTHLVRGRILSWHLIVIAGGAYLAYSRAAIVAVAVVLVIGFVLSIGQRKLRPLRWVVYAGLLVGAIAAVRGDLQSLIEPRRDFSFDGDIRFELWRAALIAWGESPLFGAGLGQFREATSQYVDSTGSLLAHNTYLSFLAEGGILGIALFLLIPGAIVLQLMRERGIASRLLLLSIATFMAMAATLNLQNFRPMWVLLAFALAWCIAQSRNGAEGSAGKNGVAGSPLPRTSPSMHMEQSVTTGSKLASDGASIKLNRLIDPSRR